MYQSHVKQHTNRKFSNHDHARKWSIFRSKFRKLSFVFITAILACKLKDKKKCTMQNQQQSNNLLPHICYIVVHSHILRKLYFSIIQFEFVVHILSKKFSNIIHQSKKNLDVHCDYKQQSNFNVCKNVHSSACLYKIYHYTLLFDHTAFNRFQSDVSMLKSDFFPFISSIHWDLIHCMKFIQQHIHL